MIVDMIGMLTPPNAKMLDPYDETLTTGMEALKSFRFFDEIEKVYNRLRKAVVRLRKLVEVWFWDRNFPTRNFYNAVSDISTNRSTYETRKDNP